MEILPPEITYEPIKKIVLHDIQAHPLEDFVELSVIRGGAIGWCEGLLYSVGHFNQTPTIVDDKLQGIEHWQVIEYAVMPKFQSEITNKQNMKCMIINQSKHPLILDIVKFVKEQEHV